MSRSLISCVWKGGQPVDQPLYFLQELEMLLYIRQRWSDYRLSWNSTDVSRIKVREHLLDKLWIPDIRMRNLKDAKRFHDFGGINMNLYSNGRIYYSQLWVCYFFMDTLIFSCYMQVMCRYLFLSRALVKLFCPMDLRKFPMDKQTCQLRFSSCKYRHYEWTVSNIANMIACCSRNNGSI